MFAAFVINFTIERSELNLDASELITFFYPSANLVVFPLVQLLLSDVLRAEAQALFGAFTRTLSKWPGQ